MQAFSLRMARTLASRSGMTPGWALSMSTHAKQIRCYTVWHLAAPCTFNHYVTTYGRSG